MLPLPMWIVKVITLNTAVAVVNVAVVSSLAALLFSHLLLEMVMLVLRFLKVLTVMLLNARHVLREHTHLLEKNLVFHVPWDLRPLLSVQLVQVCVPAILMS